MCCKHSNGAVERADLGHSCFMRCGQTRGGNMRDCLGRNVIATRLTCPGNRVGLGSSVCLGSGIRGAHPRVSLLKFWVSCFFFFFSGITRLLTNEPHLPPTVCGLRTVWASRALWGARANHRREVLVFASLCEPPSSWLLVILITLLTCKVLQRALNNAHPTHLTAARWLQPSLRTTGFGIKGVAELVISLNLQADIALSAL